MAVNTVWLFNIQPHNWRSCADGPPDLDFHGDHVGNPWHGLNSNTEFQADRMKRGELALVRESGTGIRGLWQIEETAPVTSQDHHEWGEDYEQFIYCRPLVQEFDVPIDDTEFLHHHDFARFNAGANDLSDEYRRKYLENILERGLLSDSVRATLESELDLVKVSDLEDSVSTDTGTSSNDTPTIPKATNTAGTRRTQTRDTVVVSEAFRDRILRLYEDTCLLTDISGAPFVTLAHVDARADSPEVAEHPENVLILNWLHHRAFDAGIFTFDTDLRLRVRPNFSTESEFLSRSLVARDGERIEFPDRTTLDPKFIESRNADLEWW